MSLEVSAFLLSFTGCAWRSCIRNTAGVHSVKSSTHTGVFLFYRLVTWEFSLTSISVFPIELSFSRIYTYFILARSHLIFPQFSSFPGVELNFKQFTTKIILRNCKGLQDAVLFWDLSGVPADAPAVEPACAGGPCLLHVAATRPGLWTGALHCRAEIALTSVAFSSSFSNPGMQWNPHFYQEYLVT